MKKVFFYVLSVLVLGPFPALSQTTGLSKIDSLALAALRDEPARVDALIEWAYDAKKRDQETLYAQTALSKASRIGYAKGRSYSLVKLGHIAADAGKYQESQDFYQKALFIRDSLHLAPEVASCYNNLGLLQKKQSNYAAAVEWFERGLTSIKGEGILLISSTLHSNLGTVLRYQGKYEKALFHFNEAMSIGWQLNDISVIASARMNLSALLQDNLDAYAAARDSLELCLADFASNPEFKAKCHILLGNNGYYTSDYQKALNHYEQAQDLAEHLSSDERAILIKNRGRIYLQQQYFDKALEDFQTSLDTFKALGNKREAAATLFEIGNVHYEQGKLKPAVVFYQNALTYGPDDPILKSQILFFLPEALDQLGLIDQANSYRNEYKKFMGTLDSAQTHAAWKNLMVYQSAREAIERRLLRQEIKDNQWRNTIRQSILGIMVILASLAFYIHRQKRHLAERNAEIAQKNEEQAQKDKEIALKNTEIARKNEQIAIQEKLEMLKTKELEAQYARLEGQDNMQKQIGKELHDGIGTMLATVKLNLAPVDEVLDNLSESSRRQYVSANRMLDEACTELRRIAHELGSALLAKFGLKAQLEAFKEAISGSNKLHCELSVHGLQERLDYKMEVDIYRMVQELVNNVIKHAQASKLTIQVSRFDNVINVIVEDNGTGFDLEKAHKKPGFGMTNLEARVLNHQGKLFIDTRIGRGTTVSIDIPVFQRSD